MGGKWRYTAAQLNSRDMIHDGDDYDEDNLNGYFFITMISLMTVKTSYR